MWLLTPMGLLHQVGNEPKAPFRGDGICEWLSQCVVAGEQGSATSSSGLLAPRTIADLQGPMQPGVVFVL